jgi:hypothetical protein
MPPEEPHNVVALWLDAENGVISCRGERVFPAGDELKVSWYTATTSTPVGYVPVLQGVVFAYKDSVANVVQVDRFCPTLIGGHYRWRDQANSKGLMICLVLPLGQTLSHWEPSLVEAKTFADRVAVFWLLYPTSDFDSSVSAEWSLSKLVQGLDPEVERINRAIGLTRKRETSTDYDVALSFAGEDRAYVEQIAGALIAAGVRVFYDKLEEAELWGKNLYSHLTEIYQKRARFTIMFISHWYAAKRWTNFEREAAQARAFAESREYILPVRLDDTQLTGMLPTTAYIWAKDRRPEEIANLVLRKLESNAV